jgi:hypothetical protein
LKRFRGGWLALIFRGSESAHLILL